MASKRALITRITGQGGSYLSELLLDKRYEVHGVACRSSVFTTDRIDHLDRDPHEQGTRLFLHYGELVDGTAVRRILERVKPLEVYHLGAQSHVKVGFEEPRYTGTQYDSTMLGPHIRRSATAAERTNAISAPQSVCCQ